MIGGIGSSNNNKGGGDIQAITYTVEDFLLVTAKRVRPSFSLVSSTSEPEDTYTMSDQNYHRATVFMMIFVVDLVEVILWLVSTGKFSQGDIYTPFTTPIPTFKIRPRPHSV